MALTHIDCFSGPGGICTGLHAAGFDTRVAIEFIESCVETYSKNHPEVHVIHSDIRKVTAEQILPYIPEEGIDLVTSGMPCETFSTAGNTSRSFYDDRQFLFREGIRIAQIAKAKMILFENVPAIITKTVAKDDPTLIVDVLEDELREAGYTNMIQVILDATQFGVPQRRKRFFILATRDENLVLSAPTPTCKNVVTVADAFVDLPNVIPNSETPKEKYNSKSSDYSKLMRDDAFWHREELHTDKITYHYPMKHRQCTLERFSLLHPGESLKDLFDRYQGEEREELQERRVLPKKMFINGNNLVFGCVQAKTSIRDRVGRDRDFSIPVMERHFWSAAVVLDGAYLAMPKFNKMVNGGGTTQYAENGWHGMYSMSNIEDCDRIYKDENLDILVEHAHEASQKFTSARQRFDRYWRALNNH